MPNVETIVNKALDQGKGVLRLTPAWVPRSFCIPGKRLKLHPDDYFAFGGHRGGIDERWFASTTRADNGPETLPDEGMSYIVFSDGAVSEKVLLKEAIDLLGRDMLGADVMAKHGGWTMYSKYFDNMEPLPHHLHQDDEGAKAVGRLGKPEGYYFPTQLNNHGGWFPYTFFGLNPGTTRDQVIRCLQNWEKGDNGILYLSRAYRLKPGTGWDVPPGILHAPGSLLTYEPQRSSDVFAMFQSLVWEQYTPWDLLVKDVPDAHKQDLDYIVDLIDWEKNLDPDFYAHRFLAPVPLKPLEEMHTQGYEENSVVYNSEFFNATELTILPGHAVTIRDDAAYGAIIIQGQGTMNGLPVESPALIRFGQLTSDEVFVAVGAARQGVNIVNTSETDNLVMLKHFGPKV